MKNLRPRNPLSIIALFISLIYGISALLLGASIESLTPDNQERLVWFIILFPIGILLAFLYLVTQHHRKLYSPSDFRTDESFLTSEDPEEIGRKYIEEGQPDKDSCMSPAADENAPSDETSENAEPILKDEDDGVEANDKVISGSKSSERSKNTPSSANSAAFAYMIEGLVMQELQNEYQSPIRRDTAFPLGNGRSALVDGIIEGPSGALIAEIKVIRSKGYPSRRIRDAVDQLRLYINAARESMNPKTSGILILVLDGLFEPAEINRIKLGAENISGDDISVRILNSKDLVRKYGLSSSQF
jgi:hypothetical protein